MTHDMEVILSCMWNQDSEGAWVGKLCAGICEAFHTAVWFCNIGILDWSTGVWITFLAVGRVVRLCVSGWAVMFEGLRVHPQMGRWGPSISPISKASCPEISLLWSLSHQMKALLWLKRKRVPQRAGGQGL